MWRVALVALVVLTFTVPCVYLSGVWRLSPTVPAYPNAQNVDRRVEYNRHSGKDDVTTFDTADTPETVLMFYRDRVTNQGRRSWKRFHYAEDGEVLTAPDQYSLAGCGSFITRRQGWYSLRIEPIEQPSGLTRVTVTAINGVCE